MNKAGVARMHMKEGRIFLHGFIHNKPFTHGLSQSIGKNYVMCLIRRKFNVF